MRLAGHLKRLANYFLRRRGLQICSESINRRDFAQFLALYRQYGPNPKLVFDIGVGHGTPWLYEAFPAAHFVLVEPLREFSNDIQKWMQKYDGEWHHLALGEDEGEVVLHVPVGGPTGTSMLLRDPAWARYMRSRGDGGTVERTVTASTLDRVADGRDGNHVIKIDVEGSEMRVLRGGVKCVRTADIIILECAITKRHVEEASFIEIGFYLISQGFQLLDIVDMSDFGPHRMLAYVDAIFVRSDNPFLTNVMS